MHFTDACPKTEANHSLLEASDPSSEAATASGSHVSPVATRKLLPLLDVANDTSEPVIAQDSWVANPSKRSYLSILALTNHVPDTVIAYSDLNICLSKRSLSYLAPEIRNIIYAKAAVADKTDALRASKQMRHGAVAAIADNRVFRVHLGEWGNHFKIPKQGKATEMIQHLALILYLRSAGIQPKPLHDAYWTLDEKIEYFGGPDILGGSYHLTLNFGGDRFAKSMAKGSIMVKALPTSTASDSEWTQEGHY
jgi:hypothetical protein